MSVASEERINDVVSYIEEQQHKTPGEIAVHFGWSNPDTVRRYLQDADRMDLWDKLRKAEEPYTGESRPSPQSLIQKERKKYDAGDTLQPEPVENSNKVKLAFGDLHLTDEDVMWRSIKSTIDNVIEYLNAKDYRYLELLNIGDTVSGTSIYRGQEARNLTNKPHWQTMGASLFQRDFIDRIMEETSIEDYELHIIKGNHDQAGSSHGTNLAYYMTRDLQAIGVHANYEGGHYESDNIYCVHGFGGSDYRPQSPQFSRTMQKRLHNVIQEEGRNMNRILHGHTHWADTDFRYTISVKFDCLGGYQRNKREDLGKLQRPAGMIIYEHEKEIWEEEKDWKPTLIQPDKNVFWGEAEQTDLEVRNVERIGHLFTRSAHAQQSIMEDFGNV